MLEKEIILNMRLNFFTQKTVNDWNSLSREATTAKDVNQFKNHIDYLFQSECNAGGGFTWSGRNRGELDVTDSSDASIALQG